MSEPQVVKPDSPPPDFPQFGRLPIELRLIIWEMAMDEPRTISFLGHHHEVRTLAVIGGEFGDNFYDAPEFFFVSKECRAVATKVYTNALVEISNDGFGSVEINVKVKPGDRLVFGPQWEGREQKAGGTLTKSVKQGDHWDLNLNRLSTKEEQRDWLLSLAFDGCLSKRGLEFCRTLNYNSHYTVHIYPLALSLENLSRPLRHWKTRWDED